MIDKVRKPKTVIYKRAEFSTAGLVLETLLREAFTKAPKPGNRRQKMGSAEIDSAVRRVIGASTNERKMICGSLLLYEIGKDVSFVIEDEEADEFVIETQNPAKGLAEDNKKRELLQSALYFGVWGNHVVILQTQALKAKDFESHLNWLFGELTSVIPVGHKVYLSDEPTLEAREKIENLPVKMVEIGAPLESQQDDAAQPMDQQVRDVRKISHKLFGKAAKALAAFLDGDVLERLKLENTLEESNLEVTLQLKYRRKTDDSGHAALDQIARALRHAEPDETRVTTGSGTVIRGDQLKLSGTVVVDTWNGVVDTGDLYSQMYKWLEERIAEGSIG